MGKCKVDNCERPVFTKGYCRSHDGQIRNHGKILYGKKFKELESCTVSGCDKVTVATGLCSQHYFNKKRNGSPEAIRKKKTDHPLYEMWCGMIARCHNKNHISYEYYGGSGIIVCDLWRENFWNFVDDMGDRPTEKHQIDRKDNDSNYEVSNCQWLTAKENCNKKNSSIVTSKFIEEIKTLKDSGFKQLEIIEKTGYSRSTIQRAYKQIRETNNG